MLTRRMSSTGDDLSILGFGCMRLPGRNPKIDEPRATAMIRGAIDRGLNYIDTAVPYHAGQSEPFVGRVLQDGYRERVKLATKLPPWKVKTREDMDRILGEQLEKLQTDHIDYYLVHSLNAKSWETMRGLGVTDFLDAALADGRIANAGFSFHGKLRGFQTIVDGYDWKFCQIQYNILDTHRQAGTEGLMYAADKGLGIIVMEPLRGGSLTKSVPPSVQTIWDSGATKRTPAEWALRWVWNHPQVNLILSGMSTEEQVDENIRIAGEATAESLTPEELDILDRATAAYQALERVPCTACGYCMPCPAGVDIPGCFDVLNDLGRFGDRRHSRLMYSFRVGGVTSPKPAYASLCTNCGKCVTACPQEINVPVELLEVRRELEWFLTKPIAWMIKRRFGSS